MLGGGIRVPSKEDAVGVAQRMERQAREDVMRKMQSVVVGMEQPGYRTPRGMVSRETEDGTGCQPEVIRYDYERYDRVIHAKACREPDEDER
jgi:hypothetical protein